MLSRLWENRQRHAIAATFIALFVFGQYAFAKLMDGNTDLNVQWLLHLYVGFAAGGAAALVWWLFRVNARPPA